MADDDNQLVKLAALGAAGFAAYKFLYVPYAQKQLLQAELARQTQANLSKGMTLEDASTAAVSGACQAVAAFYRISPDKSGGVCHGIGALATWSTKVSIKATIAAAKLAGRGLKVVGKGIGKGGKAVGSAVKFASYTAPKKATVATAKAIKFVSYTAPKKVTIAVAKNVGKGAAKVAKSISHGFGLWGVEEANEFYEARRQLAGVRSSVRRRRSLGGISSRRPARRVSGAAFYTRHL